MSNAVLQDLNGVVIDSGILLEQAIPSTNTLVSKRLLVRPFAYGVVFYCKAPVTGTFTVTALNSKRTQSERSSVSYTTPNELVRIQVDYAPECTVIFAPSGTSTETVYVEGFSYGYTEDRL